VACCPAPAGRTRFELADIVRQHRHELEARVKLTGQQRRALSAIALCRTAALGGHLEACCSCGHEYAAYNSCRNRHCPKCQALAQEQWIAARSARILPAPHFHVVFTLPSELRALARYQPKLIYDAFFHATGETLLELGRSRSGALLGVSLVLHTWTRALGHHPHLHAIVTCGGLAPDTQRWVDIGRNYLFPLQVMGTLLRAKMMASLSRMYAAGQLKGFDSFEDPQGFDRLMGELKSTDWLTYAKKPFRRPDHVLRYLGRYTHRVAISNSRLLNVTDDLVTFRTKNGKTESIHPVEFLRRFVQHVLPQGFVKIRHYGLYAAAHVHGHLATARKLLTPSKASNATPVAIPPSSCLDHLRELTGRDARRCPVCGGQMVQVAVLAPSARAPPRLSAAA
jgi:hypothetical protein